MAALLALGGAALQALNPDLPATAAAAAAATGNRFGTYWYTTPAVTARDTVLGAAVGAALVAWGWSGKWHVAVQRDDSHSRRTFALRLVDLAQRVVLLLAYAATVAFKVSVPGRWPYLAMHCQLHAATLTFLALPLLRGGRPAAGRLSFIALLGAAGTVLAMSAPDTSDLGRPGEKVVFWTLHAVLLSLPVTWLFTRRFPIYAGLRPVAATTGILLLIAHVPVQALSIVTGTNLTYMMVPPPPMAHLGDAYRLTFSFALLPLIMLITRYVIVGGLLHVRDVVTARCCGRCGGPKRKAV